MKKTTPKGGPGSGRHSDGGLTGRIGPFRPARSGVRPSDLYPYGRHPDGSPRTINDIRVPPKR